MYAVNREFFQKDGSAGFNLPADADYGGETGAFYPAPACFPPASAFRREYTVFFGGNYHESWSENYILSISYENQKGVQAAFMDGCWQAVGGDRELVILLNSRKCPKARPY